MVNAPEIVSIPVTSDSLHDVAGVAAFGPAFKEQEREKEEAAK